MTINKKTGVLLWLIVYVFAGIAATHPGGIVHENLKVLPKDISKEDLDKVMESYEKALGVECGYCHVKNKKDTLQWNYADDEKPEKEITRKMMKMTEKINHEFFEYKMTYKPDELELIAVKCNTCHFGSPRPELREKKEQ